MRAPRRLLPLALLLLAAVTASCRTTPRAEEPRTTVRVDNRGFPDMVIYVLQGAQSVRIGTATGNSSTVLTIPATMVFGLTTMRFRADPIGGNRTPVSQEITIRPGEQVELIIPPS